ncbi:MAG TPA: 2-dehydro-3-deoxy-6-phosphogalactonate aldolase [Terracidiphilus sp.]|nr:2-dehydro-3-deoxy-6-phosphogalactonate aldolase [Terracidiphilus sp.]
MCGLVGILRGLPPEEAVATATILYDVGFRTLEVPLNSPSPLISIRSIRDALPKDCRVGAGTVFRPVQIEDVNGAGGEFIVMPHCDPTVIQASLLADLEVIPGVATPSEAFAAYSVGATLLKVFPAADIGASAMKAWLAVLPDDISLVPVGGITAANMSAYYAGRVIGFGLGTALYAPSMTRNEIRQRGQDFVAAWQALTGHFPKDTQ